MPKYLFIVSYTADGAKGVLKAGRRKRRAAAEQAVKAVGQDRVVLLRVRRHRRLRDRGCARPCVERGRVGDRRGEPGRSHQDGGPHEPGRDGPGPEEEGRRPGARTVVAEFAHSRHPIHIFRTP
jgi:hypothetical protein